MKMTDFLLGCCAVSLVDVYRLDDRGSKHL
jgi:hypothetical protein